MRTVTKEQAPVPLDPFGNEVCLLFLKYGKCRYKKKCKLSHILPDKDAPFMQQVTPTAIEQPVVKLGPKIAFPVRRIPYARPPSSSNATLNKASRFSNAPNQQRTKQGPPQHEATHQGTEHHDTSHQGTESEYHNKVMRDQETDQTTCAAPPPTAIDTIATTPTTLDDHEMIPVAQEKDQQPKRKLKRPPKVRPKCLLASLFMSTITDSTMGKSDRRPSVNTFEIGKPASREPIQRKTTIGSMSRSKGKSSLSKPSTQASRSSAMSTDYSTNETSAGNEKIEQWYITNKAHLDPKSRRLMVLTKPTTVRQKSQLKAMRKQHWECRTEIEHQLKKNMPATYSLKIAKSRIDWEKVSPYVTLMIQAALEMDIEHQHLPTIGTTLCTLLEHKDLSGIACEKLLVSWGLTEIDARRFTSHLWEVMVAAAGEADIRGSKGFGLCVRQYEGTEDYKRVQDRLSELNKASA